MPSNAKNKANDNDNKSDRQENESENKERDDDNGDDEGIYFDGNVVQLPTDVVLDLSTGEEAKAENDNAIISKAQLTTNCYFDEEKVEEQDECTDLHNIVPTQLTRAPARRLQQQPTRPGAIAVGGRGANGPIRNPNDNYNSTIGLSHGSSRLSSLASSKPEADLLFHATLVDDYDTNHNTTIANATIFDKESEERVHRQRRLVAMLLSGLVTSIVAAGIAMAVVFTRPKPKLPVTFSPTLSSVPSLAPSWNPSASPSTTLFGFLVENSFDNGMALATVGSSQEKAMTWVEKEILSQTDHTVFDYKLVQYHVLVTLYYETFGASWNTTDEEYSNVQPTTEWLQKDSWNKEYNFCNWLGVACSGKDVVELQLSGFGLVGMIPPELAALDPSLRTFDVSNNVISELPSSLGQMSRLGIYNIYYVFYYFWLSMMDVTLLTCLHNIHRKFDRIIQ